MMTPTSLSGSKVGPTASCFGYNMNDLQSDTASSTKKIIPTIYLLSLTALIYHKYSLQFSRCLSCRVTAACLPWCDRSGQLQRGCAQEVPDRAGRPAAVCGQSAQGRQEVSAHS